MKQTDKTTAQKNICKHCGEEYTVLERNRVYGNNPLMGGYCSAGCYTQGVLMKSTAPVTPAKEIVEIKKWITDIPIWNVFKEDSLCLDPDFKSYEDAEEWATAQGYIVKLYSELPQGEPLVEKFTKGEWELGEIYPSKIYVDGKRIGSRALITCEFGKMNIDTGFEVSEEEAEANARLIAEAKNMYDALKIVYRCLNLEYKGHPMPPDKDLENIKEIINRIANK